MRESTFEKFDYAIRPAKNIERKMFCEAFARLSRLAPLATYGYVGFGALGFHDFCLFHQRLGIRRMTSIEGNLEAKDRIEKNIPYKCIEMRWGMSHDVLPQFDWSKRVILWLDYEKPFETKMLGDISLACSQMVSGSILIVTTPADPGELGPDGSAEKRLQQLISRVGVLRVPRDTTAQGLAKWGMARTLREVINNEIQQTLVDRNGVLDTPEKIEFRQLFNFHYADGSRMLSVGGVMLNTEDRTRLGDDQFQDLDYYRPGTDSFLIETPLLTQREIKLLDEQLPAEGGAVSPPAWIPEQERLKYGRVYRYFPSFSEVET